MPPGIFHVHEHLELKSRRASTSSYTYQPVIHEERTFATKDSSIPGLPSQGEILISAQNDKSNLSAHIGICSYFLTLRWWVLGMRISSRYFATVRRVT